MAAPHVIIQVMQIWNNTGRLQVVPKVGMEAPDFELESHLRDRVRLSEYRGRHNVLIAFFPLAWTPV